MKAERNKPNRVANTGMPLHFNGSVGTTEATINVLVATEKELSTSVTISNTHGSQDLLVSFDGSANFYTIPSGTKERFEVSVFSFRVKGSGAATTYELIVTV